MVRQFGLQIVCIDIIIILMQRKMLLNIRKVFRTIFNKWLCILFGGYLRVNILIILTHPFINFIWHFFVVIQRITFFFIRTYLCFLVLAENWTFILHFHIRIIRSKIFVAFTAGLNGVEHVENWACLYHVLGVCNIHDVFLIVVVDCHFIEITVFHRFWHHLLMRDSWLVLLGLRLSPIYFWRRCVFLISHISL